MSPHPKTTAFLGTAALFLFLDQLSKFIVRASLQPYKDEWVILPNLLSIAHAKNTGAAFSAMDDWEYRYYVFFTLTGVAVVVLWQGYKQLRIDDRLQGAAMGFILAGALGNFIDRLLFRAVTDMIKVQWGWEPGKAWLRDLPPLHSHVWPIFNIADSCIFIGLGLFAISFIYEKDRPAEEAEAVKAPGSSTPSLE